MRRCLLFIKSVKKHLFFVFLFCVQILGTAQTKALADFSFNNESKADASGALQAKLVNVSFTEDRFGNKNNALHLFGNMNSYVNLGNSSALKPKAGSISLWVNIENALWYGTGYDANPLILTKSSNGDDFFEAYAIYYMFKTKKVSATCTKDSTNQVFFSSMQDFELQKWHHLVFCYDQDFAAFYIDGELENKFKTGFQVKFLEEDSVLLGVTANKKNNRFFSGSVDDIQFYDKVLNGSEVQSLYRAPNPNRFSQIMYWIRLGLLALSVLVVIVLIIRNRINRKLKRYQETLRLQTKLLEAELRVNRALMNPHFIFNSLNSIQNLILNTRNDEANLYLLKFSKLMRKILESNTSDSISLTDEIDILERYLEIEQLRFEEDFTYKIKVHPELKPSQVRIPIMMIQPFVENSIWHGLITKEGERILEIRFEPMDTTYILCIVDDNGVGRQERDDVLREKTSMATIFVRSRLELFNKIYDLKCELTIVDKPGQGGTQVKIILPLLK